MLSLHEEAENKKEKEPTYKRGISTMSWMRQHSNSSMRSSHSVPEMKQTQSFLDFQIPKESKGLNTEIQTINILIKEQTLKEKFYLFKEMALFPEIEGTQDCRQRKW